MATQAENTGREYIVEYRAGQFQNGSLVLRFAHDPSERELRDALVAYGLPGRALEQVRARPVPPVRINTPRPRPGGRDSRTRAGARPGNTPQLRGTHDPSTGRETWVSSAAGTSPTTSPTVGTGPEQKRSGGCLGPLLALVVMAFLVVGLFSQPAIDVGGQVGSLVPEDTNPTTVCIDSLEFLGDPDEGLLSQLFSTSPTDFPVTPANAAFLVSCMATALD